MEFIPVSPRLPDHPKTLALCSRVGMKPMAVWPRVVMVWFWAFDHAKDGDVSLLFGDGLKFGITQRVLDLPKKRALEFLEAMVDVGFLERTEGGRVAIHDWEDWIGGFLEGYRKRRERAVKAAHARWKQDAQADTRAEDANGKREVKPTAQVSAQVDACACSQSDAQAMLKHMHKHDANAHAGAHANGMQTHDANITGHNITKHNNTPPYIPPHANADADASDLHGSDRLEHGKDPPPYKQLVELYNQICAKAGCVACQTLNDARRKHLAARWREHPDIEWWKDYFRKVAASPFLCGDNPKGWRANFDFVTRASSVPKILEGFYAMTNGQRRRHYAPSNVSGRGEKL